MNAMDKSPMNTQQQLIAAYGCNKYQLADKMRNNFHIPDEFLGALVTYRVEHFSGREFDKLLFDGMIRLKDVWFAVIYNKCTPYHAKRALEIRLSFREAKPEFNIEPIVLVQIVQEAVVE